jgi:hypothetical protein
LAAVFVGMVHNDDGHAASAQGQKPCLDRQPAFCFIFLADPAKRRQIVENEQVHSGKRGLKGFLPLGRGEVRKEISKSTNAEMEVTIVRVEDQRPNKKGLVYEMPSPLPDERKNEHLQYDRTAILSLEAIGERGKEVKVEERTSFALPFNAPKKQYFLKKVSPTSIIVEYSDDQGALKTLEIPKGGTSRAPE